MYNIQIVLLFGHILSSAFSRLCLINITSSGQSDYCAFHLTFAFAFAQHLQHSAQCIAKVFVPARHVCVELPIANESFNFIVSPFFFCSRTFGRAFCTHHVRQVVNLGFLHFYDYSVLSLLNNTQIPMFIQNENNWFIFEERVSAHHSPLFYLPFLFTNSRGGLCSTGVYNSWLAKK